MLEERINQLAEDVRVLKEVLADKLKERQDKIDEMKKEAEQKAHEAEAGVPVDDHAQLRLDRRCRGLQDVVARCPSGNTSLVWLVLGRRRNAPVLFRVAGLRPHARSRSHSRCRGMFGWLRQLH